eukprot:m.122102 g.122102  ORF g.122102 m.122102 type:complete len:287 (-) comp16217_c0_seq2:157-1017(-)
MAASKLALSLGGALRSLTNKSRRPLIIFDKDGTLYDTSAAWKLWIEEFVSGIHSFIPEEASRHRLMDSIGYCPKTQTVKGNGYLASLPWAAIRQKLHELAVLETGGLMPHAVFEKAMQRSDDLVASRTAEFHREIFPLAAAFDALRTHGFRISICTADYHSPTHHALKASRVLDMVDTIVGCDDGFPAKPSPEAAAYLIKRANSEASCAAIVGDSIVDMQFGRNSGLALRVGVLSGSSSRQELEPLATHMVAHAGEMIALLLQDERSAMQQNANTDAAIIAAVASE